jgi:hypothetical protein
MLQPVLVCDTKFAGAMAYTYVLALKTKLSETADSVDHIQD